MMPWSALYLLAPKVPVMNAGTGLDPLDAFSLFNHPLAGVLVIVLAVFTALEGSPLGNQHPWLKYLWPLPLFVEATNVVLRGDSELKWPLRLATIMPDAEAVQHKIFALLTFGIAFIELFRRTGHLTHPGWRYVFYGLMFGGGGFLLFHSGAHTAVIHRPHLWIGTWCITAATTKILGAPKSGLASLRRSILPVFIPSLGLQLAFYVE